MFSATMTPDTELDTLADTGDAPESAGDESLSWQPHGSWLHRGRNAATLGSDTDGRIILDLSIVTTRPPAGGELSHVADAIDAKARADALARLQATPQWTAFVESKGEHNAVKHRLDALDEESRQLEAERLQLAARPRGHGQRLAEIQSRQDAMGKEKHAATLELRALEPILAEARRNAQQCANGLAQETIHAIHGEQQQALDAALSAFCRRHADELIDIAARVSARSIHRHDSWLASLKSFVLARLESAQPALEPREQARR